MIKKRILVSLLAILVVMSHVVPSGFHLDLCNGEETHLQIAAADCSIDMSMFHEHEREASLSLSAGDCCADFSGCDNETSCHSTILLTKHSSASAPSLLYSPHPLSRFVVSNNKARNLIYFQPEIHSEKISILRTIILQV